jgi:FAD dependent oxidoreductase TIGR03364
MDFDLAIVGAGIVGLAHALAAARRGLRVVVVDRDIRANGASVRNFGLVVVSGQGPGAARRRAERSREVWLELASQTGIDICHAGMTVAAQRPEALAVLEGFAATADGRACRLVTTQELIGLQPGLDGARLAGGLVSPHELRVESREAIPRLAAFLEERHSVLFRRGAAVAAVAPPLIETSQGPISAGKVVICPGDDLVSLYPERIASHDVRRCKLQMLRLADPGFRIGALVSDLSLLRYDGYAGLPEAEALRQVLQSDRAAALDNGVHLIVVQSADGSLVVGDSHHYDPAPDPFASEEVDNLILDEFATLFGRTPDVLERWTGTYASARGLAVLEDKPHDDVRIVVVTSGTGASTAFAIGEETIADLFG